MSLNLSTFKQALPKIWHSRKIGVPYVVLCTTQYSPAYGVLLQYLFEMFLPWC